FFWRGSVGGGDPLGLRRAMLREVVEERVAAARLATNPAA
ncbi:hypothetical protein BV898_19934, partial [Hypsibius exemplaris]